MVTAAVLLAVMNLLDCAHGQLARILGKGSQLGKTLDIMGDFATHLAIFFGVAHALSVRAGSFYPYFLALSSSEGSVVTVNGRSVIMLGSNNYLGLTHHPEVMKAAHDAIDRYGTSCTGSRFLNGNLDIHETLETELADFVHKEAALVFSSGFLANCGTVGLLASPDGAVVFSASENHASLIGGTRMARRAQVRVYDGPEDLARQLATAPSWSHALVITDAVFSMTGRVADLRAIVELKRQYGFRLYVDDAHGLSPAF